MDKVKLISGNSNKELAGRISDVLAVSLVKAIVEKFPNTEIRVEINEDIRGCDVFIIQTGGADEKNSINDYLMETLLLIDACKRSGARTVNAILATYPYARSDKKDKPRVPIGGKLVANLLEAAGCDRVISMDLHSGQIQGFTNLPFDNLYAINLHIDNLKQNLFKNMTNEEINEKYVLVSLDLGGAKRIREYSKRLSVRHALIDKQRDYSRPGNVVKSILVGEDIKGKTAILVDDIIDSAGTLKSGLDDLVKHGCTKAICIFTHGIFSGPAFDRLKSCDIIEKVIVTNTLDQQVNISKYSLLEVVDTAPLLSEVIKRLTVGGSLSALFE